MTRFVYVMPLLGSIAGTLTIAATALLAGTAPQQAAGFALACALAVVPYVFARSIAALDDTSQSQQRRQTEALDKLARALAPDKP